MVLDLDRLLELEVRPAIEKLLCVIQLRNTGDLEDHFNLRFSAFVDLVLLCWGKRCAEGLARAEVEVGDMSDL